MTDVVCVIDAGTSSIRAGLVDGKGTVLVQHAVPVPIAHPSPDAAEQSPSAVRAAVLSALDAVAGSEHAVTAIIVSAQRASIAVLDPSGAPTSPFLLWMDRRGATAMTELDERLGRARFSEITGLPFGAMPGVMRLLWLRGRGGRLDGCRVVGVQDWVTSTLTESLASPVDASAAGWTGIMDPSSAQWSDEILDALGLTSITLPPVARADDAAGVLSPNIAARLGWSSSVPVLVGGGDQQCSSIGSGVFAPGAATINLGTSATIVTPARSDDPTPPGTVRTGHMIRGLEVREATVPSCGSALSWLSTTLGTPVDDLVRDKGLPLGSDGLRFVASLAGLGTPTWRPTAGWMRGLTPAHGSRHLARALVEGIALQVRHAMEALTPRHGIAQVTVIGGAARSDLICQAIADVSRVEIARPAVDPQEAAIRGAATVAWARVLGLDVASALSSRATTIMGPDPELEATADRMFTDYLSDLDAAPTAPNTQEIAE